MAKLDGIVALVTGGGSGIGLAIATSFAREGARVIITGRSQKRLEKARSGAGDLASRIEIHPADVADRGQVRELVRQIDQTAGKVDILVNNAGVNVVERSLAKLASEDWDRMVAVNLNGAFYCTQEVLPGMREKGKGLIINISSVAGVRITEVAGVGYAASKYGMSAMSYFTGIEEREHGIRTCLICPGEVNTPILDQRPVPVPEERRRQILQPEDIAAAALFVATLPDRVSVPELIMSPVSARFG